MPCPSFQGKKKLRAVTFEFVAKVDDVAPCELSSMLDAFIAIFFFSKACRRTNSSAYFLVSKEIIIIIKRPMKVAKISSSRHLTLRMHIFIMQNGDDCPTKRWREKDGQKVLVGR